MATSCQVLRWVAAAIFLVMGVLLIRKPAATLTADSRLTRPGLWAGFSVGVAAVIGNPKAILFYMGALPGFFTLAALTGAGYRAILADLGADADGRKPGPCAVPRPRAAASVQPRTRAAD